ncbi:hypothetical protein CC117_07380 [Parafrankia colletiae]|uniref:Copper(I)-binding protein n=1 Tax=Parafrankia colletiae TaxID=573497 RepID=A0A1S1QAG2_9ACTN|nr:hypothetical protein [Parafrankia colletiae]MCK9904050.1 hypothetical protein [Frankia sp. Cpl3]OHV29204.1 hypothetical protein CC117_07380 [Parafrankia colletiae]
MSRRLGARSATSTTMGTPPVDATDTDGPSHAPRAGAGAPAARRSGTRRRAAIAASSVAAAIVTATLSGCASGTDAVTNSARTTTNSVSGSVGSVTLRNVYVAGPADEGGTAQIISAVFNGGAEEDSLITVSSPAASGGQAPSPSIIRPGGGNIYIANGSAPTLTGLTEDLMVGAEIPVTFTFAKSGSLTLDVPIEPPAPGASAAATAGTTLPATEPATTSPATASTPPEAGAGTPGAGGTAPAPTAPAETAPAATAPVPTS